MFNIFKSRKSKVMNTNQENDTIVFRGETLSVGQQIRIIKPSCQEGYAIVTDRTYANNSGDTLLNLKPDPDMPASKRGGTYAYNITI